MKWKTVNEMDLLNTLLDEICPLVLNDDKQNPRFIRFAAHLLLFLTHQAGDHEVREGAGERVVEKYVRDLMEGGNVRVLSYAACTVRVMVCIFLQVDQSHKFVARYAAKLRQEKRVELFVEFLLEYVSESEDERRHYLQEAMNHFEADLLEILKKVGEPLINTQCFDSLCNSSGGGKQMAGLQ
jgi:hypothetical protein